MVDNSIVSRLRRLTRSVLKARIATLLKFLPNCVTIAVTLSLGAPLTPRRGHFIQTRWMKKRRSSAVW